MALAARVGLLIFLGLAGCGRGGGAASSDPFGFRSAPESVPGILARALVRWPPEPGNPPLLLWWLDPIHFGGELAVCLPGGESDWRRLLDRGWFEPAKEREGTFELSTEKVVGRTRSRFPRLRLRKVNVDGRVFLVPTLDLVARLRSEAPAMVAFASGRGFVAVASGEGPPIARQVEGRLLAPMVALRRAAPGRLESPHDAGPRARWAMEAVAEALRRLRDVDGILLTVGRASEGGAWQGELRLRVRRGTLLEGAIEALAGGVPPLEPGEAGFAAGLDVDAAIGALERWREEADSAAVEAGCEAALRALRARRAGRAVVRVGLGGEIAWRVPEPGTSATAPVLRGLWGPLRVEVVRVGTASADLLATWTMSR